jgi:hypothetical protein
MAAFISAHGGVLALAVLAVALFNIVMSAIGQIFSALAIQEPSGLQKVAAVGLKISQWLSANVPAKSPPSS